MALTQISTAGVKDDAVTSGKIPANAVGSSEIAANAVGTSEIAGDAVTSTELAANAVTTVKINNDAVNNSKLAANSVSTVKIADEAVTLAKLPHGTSSNDGKFLRANNGADPSFETVTSTTINNNADNRVITGSGTANTLNGESGLTYDSTTLVVSGSGEVKALNNTANNTEKQAFFTTGHRNTSEENVLGLRIVGGDGDNVVDIGGGSGQSSYNSATKIRFYTGANETTLTGTERMRINPDGKVGLGIASPANKLHLNESTSGSNYIHFTNSSTGTSTSDVAQVGIDGNEKLILWQAENNDIRFATNNTERMRILAGGGLTFNGDTAAANALDDYEEGSWTPAYSRPNMTIGNSSQVGRYVKVGRLVTVVGSLNTTSETGSSTGGPIIVTGLPFTVRETRTALSVRPSSWSHDHPSFATFELNQTHFELLEEVEGNPSGSSDLGGSRFGGGTANFLWFGGSYLTDT